MTIVAIEQGRSHLGIRPFLSVGAGHRPDEVFIRLRHEALAEHERDSSGTIAAKCGFQLIRRDRPFLEVLERNQRLGPAWCLHVQGEQDCAWFPGPMAAVVRRALAEARAGKHQLFAFFGYAGCTQRRPAAPAGQASRWGCAHDSRPPTANDTWRT